MVQTLAARFPDQIADGVEAGLPEPNESRPSLRQALDEKKVSEILDAPGVQCLPTDVHRLGRYDESRPRLLKILLLPRSHWSSVLASSYKLRSCGFQNIYVRRSMTSAERQREFELRQEARTRNKDVESKQWVVCRGELKNISEISSFSQNSWKSENL
ncbi:hypothetical protein ANCDUO_02345 [Ancylostoma duodenale]|uniref:Uncharacterized protein n=1 Tax=Ancylostoma duodenale TaxID=51022 RepID=A0A0C2H0P9_9BILA|nr:hypothetical protein ANCDUO_02345 [Ancylostoma duodenale]